MIISHKYKFIYFKQKKVAGSSTETLLSNMCCDHDVVTRNDKSEVAIKLSRNDKGFRPHISPNQVKKKIGNTKFNNYFKFITVRNPYDRAVSWYWWREGWWSKNPLSFKDWMLSEKCKLLERFSDWIFIDSKCVIDDYIRFENLKKDTIRITKKWFDISHVSYPKLKTSQRLCDKHYTEYYDSETKKIVEEKYKKDIEYFGYEFGK